MTPESYYAIVHRLGLRPTSVETVYLTNQGDPINVPRAQDYPPEQREEIIERIKRLLGITWRFESD